MTVAYDPAKTSPDVLAGVITELAFNPTVIQEPAVRTPTEEGKRIVAPLPDDAPGFFAEAFTEARNANRPLLIDFQTEWCGACQRLKKETLEHPDVVQALQDIKLIYVDLDKFPDLAGWYGVDAVPNVILVDRDGFITDRVQNFEPPDAFLRRLKNLVGT